ncbi:MAG: carbamoyl phosphate synthase small subunit [Clostridium sp.]|uniref:carbamoyl phosphate synthase small subunit n=1 Tax=Clostridium sp. TaxID=1506 RepID=UPI0025BC1F48|nr:carbamoyl phosphate synthase small subunit [Clostridium sp.]MCH3963172.1 carbamoyl phosphate synthase small subunit [Clostridium sp.]MCI1716365.1 carbamoyl phosphate synthase small subunit [Clostridium sp.]MCI1800705.1 carbamoyl phosphate synthase small subunit [Clostridium sp.]MCI1814640.1 carbamoyl phosphate synthase small subunit [Clostridium sp.]MCI1871550.1 carbamoyl phosphate synthase small subunit [Clostridium sp.]
MKAKLILENGDSFEGEAFGYLQDTVGEVVFNTGMTGYEEILTDPSYYGQIVTMTYPLIGNYGINLSDVESESPKVKGFIVRENCKLSSNFRSELELEDYLKLNKIVGICGIDTRALTKLLRNNGTMKGIITVKDVNFPMVKDEIASFSNREAVSKVTAKNIYSIEGKRKHIAILDFGIKKSIINNFVDRGFKITVFPADTDAKTVLGIDPDLIFLSNGPGDPCDLKDEIKNIRELAVKKPTVGICLGHQLLALAFGGSTAKLKFGHRGCNHPVKDLQSGRVHITSQNHGYYVNKLPENMETTHISLNDGTIEGMRHKELPVYSIQFHPEAAPGPVDNNYIFDEFAGYASKGGIKRHAIK